MSVDFTMLRQPWTVEEFSAHTPEDDYHATLAVSSGGLKELIKSKAHFLAKYTHQKKETPALRLGRIVHKAVLEGSEFLQTYRVMPQFTGKTKDGKESARSGEAQEKKKAWLADLPQGTIVVTEEERDMITGVCTSIMNHPIARELLKDGTPEASGYFNHDGLRGKIRADFLRSDGHIIDLKTTRSAQYRAFERSAWGLMMPVQAYWYRLGAQKILGGLPDGFTFIAVEKEPPYAVMVYPADPSFMDAGERLVNLAIKRLREALETGQWPAYSTEAKNLAVPQYAMDEIETMEILEGAEDGTATLY